MKRTNDMKRFLALILALVLFSPAAACSLAEEAASDVRSYDFDLRFHMNADIFPARTRTRMQGYADLLNMLELKGNLTWCESTRSFDLNAEIIPVTNPDSAISFRLYGIPDYMALSSPLLGTESVWFQNPFLMEFAFKTWNNLRIPLQYPVLLFPYVTESAFAGLASAWNVRFGEVRKSVSFPRSDLVNLSESWSSILHNDSQLKYWIYSLSLPAKYGTVMESEFFSLPEYVLNQVFPKGGLKFVRSGNTYTWKNGQNEILFTRTSENGSSSWDLTLPATENGYLPRMAYRINRDSENRLFSLSLEGSYSLPESQDSAGASLPDSLFAVSLNMNSWPAAWPMDAAFDASLTILGILYPNTEMSFRGTSREDGYFSLTLAEPVEENGAMLDVFSCSGTVVPAASSSIPAYSRDDFTSFLSIYNVSDRSMDDFVRRTRRPLVTGLLNFLDEVPARACQSVMDDLEEYGVLDMVSVD